MNKTISSISLALIIGLSGCSLMQTDYERPQLAIVDSYQNAAEFLGNRVSDKFWTEFSDPKLTAVVENALNANLDLQSAYLNVRKARYALDEINTNLLPDFGAGGNIGTKRNLEHHDSSTKRSGTSLTLSYELDLFGRLDAERLSSFENLQASAYDYWAMRLSTIASVANAYWQYAYAKEAVQLGEEDLKDSERRLSLIKSMYDAGAADGLAYDTAMVNHLQVQETLEQRKNNLALARTALTALLGLTADKDVEVSELKDSAVPDIEFFLRHLVLHTVHNSRYAASGLQRPALPYPAGMLVGTVSTGVIPETYGKLVVLSPDFGKGNGNVSEPRMQANRSTSVASELRRRRRYYLR